MSEEKDIFERINNVEETLKTIFGNSVHIETKTVKSGGTSNNVYVPKKFSGNPVTLIIWDQPKLLSEEQEKEKEGDTNGTHREEHTEQSSTISRSDFSVEREEELQE